MIATEFINIGINLWNSNTLNSARLMEGLRALLRSVKRKNRRRSHSDSSSPIHTVSEKYDGKGSGKAGTGSKEKSQTQRVDSKLVATESATVAEDAV